MAFLKEFNGLNNEDGNTLLFEWIENNRNALFEELTIEKPILKFWSHHPGNPDLPDPAEKEPGWAYLITKRVDVKYALANFIMKPYLLRGFFVLSIDHKADHGPKRKTLQNAILVSPPDEPPDPVQAELFEQNVIVRIDEAVNESWQQIAGGVARGDPLKLDVRGFARDVALRFTGKFFGIPEDKIFDGTENLEKWSGQGFENFIWKIHARHFGDPNPDMEGALEKIGLVIHEISQTNPGPDTVIGRLFADPGTLGKGVIANLVGLIQGLIDNVMTGACYAFNQFCQPDVDEEIRNARNDPAKLKQMMHYAHKKDTPGPFLPRRGNIADLPSATVELGDNLNFACAIGAALNDPAADPDPGPDAWDIRMGWGMHQCIGNTIGDEIMVRTLAQMLKLKDLTRTGPLEKKWGWIVTNFEVSGTVP